MTNCSIAIGAVTAGFCALLAGPPPARAECDGLTRPLAARVSAAARAGAPAWVRPLIAPAQLLRFDTGNLRPLTYFLGYGSITLERLGTGGVAPFATTVVVHCHTGRAARVTDPYAWASARARELHLQVTSAELAAGYAAEVVSLTGGRRPEGAQGHRQAGMYRVEVPLAARANDAAPQVVVLEVGRDGSIRTITP